MTRFLYTLGALALMACSLTAQQSTYYKVQIGTFIDAKRADFEPLRALGLVHARDLGSNLVEVYVGGFDTRPPAEQLAARARESGYSNAFVQEVQVNEEMPASVVQMATQQVDRPIDWAAFMKAGPIYGILNGNTVKIVTGPFTSTEAAKAALPAVRELGYKDAFVKNLSSTYLVPLTEFETGVRAVPAPLEFGVQAKGGEPAPQSYDQVVEGRLPVEETSSYTYGLPDGVDEVLTPRSPAQPAVPTSYDYTTTDAATPTAKAQVVKLPAISGKIKRGSALDLQKILKANKAYNGSLDGYYGPGTKAGYEKFVAQNRSLQKYQLIAEQQPLPGSAGIDSELQGIINAIGEDASATAQLDKFAQQPLAKAYQAYQLFVNFGPGLEVNQLMNTAINKAFAGKRVEGVSFDPTATYAYQDLAQVVQHLHYVHAAPSVKEAVPCWLARRHAGETAQAQATLSNAIGKSLKLQSCGQFEDWPEVRVLVAIAADLNGEARFDQSRLAQAAAERARLYASPSALDSDARKSVENWHNNLIKGIDGWSSRDPLNERLATALKVMYHQSQVRLEDYYMGKGLKAEEAKGLALATLHTLVAYHLQRFV